MPPNSVPRDLDPCGAGGEDDMAKGATRLLALAGCVLFGLIGAPAEAKTDGQQRVVERARLALDSFLDDLQFEYMRVYVQNAYAVLIVPEVLKAGFFLGAEYGVGVLLVRDSQSGGWGQPAFYSLYGGSLGVQAGGSMSDRVFTIMNEGAVDKLIAHKVQFGGDMGLALGRIGAGVGAGTTTQFGEDVYVFSKSKGLYGGVTLDGTVVAPKHDWNESFYGRPVDPAKIVREPSSGGDTKVAALHDSLTRF
jgi:lipid-binding SYLF domain-containing protein